MTTEFQSRLAGRGDGAASSDATPEIDGLRRELDALRNGAIDRWLTMALEEGRQVRDFESSLSWRVTRPLRLAGVVTRSVRAVGFASTVRLAISRLRSRG